MHTRILNCDIFDGLNQIEDESIDLLVIDPPYNIGKQYEDGIEDKWETQDEYMEWLYKWLELSLYKLKSTGSVYIFNSTENMPYIDIFLKKKIMILSRIIWGYDSSGVQAKHFYGSLYEPIIFGVKNKKKYTFNYKEIMVKTTTGAERKLIDYRKNPPEPYNELKVPGNLWYFNRVRYKMPEYVKHSSQKPEALLERIVKASSNEGDTVLDLFAGSFSLGVVSKRLKRNYIGIEKSSTYCFVGKKRIEKIKVSKKED